MTTAAQRILEAIYAAEFVRIASALHGKIDDATGYAMQQARCAADDHSQRVTIKHASTRSRFRKRSR